MIAKRYREMLNQKSVIREISAYGAERAKEIGYENVFDFSLGNPSVPAPQIVNETIARLALEGDSLAVHGYSPSLGIDGVRQAIADSLNRRFGMNYEKAHIFPTSALPLRWLMLCGLSQSPAMKCWLLRRIFPNMCRISMKAAQC